MSNITITINHQPISCEEGESILNIARKEGIELPAICYLSGCSPTMACKLCMIDVDGKRSYGCNTKAKEGMNILTHTDEINIERNAIMQSYDVNHPLQCGVCDKSGECELQNYTLKMQVDSQHYHIKESPKPHKSWAKATYDPNLCIMCERCVTTCKDNLGEANLKAQKAVLEPLDMAVWKESMPKDALSVWARKQKALIDFVSDTPCFDCGECISVCPVGALSTNDFKYKANAWELKKIDSTCPHCPMGCKITYEVRHNDTLGTPHIYRVKNDFYFNPICGAGRYGYDITSSTSPAQNLDEAIAAFKRADSIQVGNQTTNEEAFILNHIAKTHNLTLHNQEALDFKNFINAFLTYAQKSQLNHLSDLKEAQSVIILGSAINYQVPTLRYMLNNKLKIQKGSQALYMYPLQDSLINSLSKSLTHIAYHQDALHIAIGALALAYLHTHLDSQDEDTQALRAMIEPLIESKTTMTTPVIKTIKKSVVSTNEAGEEVTQEVEEEVEEIQEEVVFQALIEANIKDFDSLTHIMQASPTLALGAEVYAHPQAQLLARILGILEAKGALKTLLIPPFSNALGLAMICDFSPQDNASKYSIGFRTGGDFVCESDYINHAQGSSAPDFTLPALNQIEGTYASIDSRILPLKPALPFYGYDLSDIAKAFGMKGDYLIDYTSLICGCEFDSFHNHYLNDGTDMRGYRLKTIALSPLSPLDSQVLQLPHYQSYNAHKLYSPSQFNHYTAKSELLQNKMGIYVSRELLDELGLKEGEILSLRSSDSKLVCGRVYIDHHLQAPYFLINPLLEGAREIFSSSSWASLTPTHKELV